MKRPGRRRGHTTGTLRARAAECGLQLGVESRGDGAFRYTLEDARLKVFAEAKGMMHAEALLTGVELGYRLAAYDKKEREGK